VRENKHVPLDWASAVDIVVHVQYFDEERLLATTNRKIIRYYITFATFNT